MCLLEGYVEYHKETLGSSLSDYKYTCNVLPMYNAVSSYLQLSSTHVIPTVHIEVDANTKNILKYM